MNEQLKIIISAEIAKLKNNVEKAKQQVKSFKEQVKDASKDVDENFKNMGAGIANGLKTAAGTAAAVSGALLALAGSTQEYRNEQAKLVTSFESAGKSAEVAKGTYNDLYRVLGDSGVATEAASHLGQLSVGQKELSEYTNICQGVYATFGDSLPIEGLTEAVNHTVNLGEVQGTLADALEWSGISTDEFNEKLAKCNSESEREKLIRNTLNGLYSDAAAKYETNNAQILAQNEAQAKLQETTARVGEALAPVLTALTTLGAEVLSVIAPYLESFASEYLPKIQEVLSAVAPLLESTLGFISEHQVILAVLGGIIAGIAAAIGLYNAVAAVKAAMDAAQVTTLWALVSAYAAQAAAMIVALAPYLAIVAAIAAVIAIIVLCVKHWDTIKEAVAKAWDWIVEKTAPAVEAIVGWFNQLVENGKNLLGSLGDLFKNIFEGITIRVKTAMSVVSGIIKAIVSVFKGDFGAAKTAVLGIFDAIKDGMKQKIENAKNTIKSVIDVIKNLFKFKFDLPKIPTPKFGISPSGWKIGDLLKGSIPKLSIQWNAVGGVFDSPTLFYGAGGLQGLGEDGAEAVVPLEKNTQWLDRIATMLSDKMGNNPVYLMVDKRVLGQTAAEGINDITKQTGNIPLVIA